MSAPQERTTLSITCALDGRAHEVPDAALAAPYGIYQAVCGQAVTASSLTEPVGAPCPRCTAR